MRIHLVNSLVACVVAGLITYGLLSLDSNSIKLASGIGAFIFILSTLTFAIGVSYDDSRAGLNLRIVSMVFFVIALIQNLLFIFFALSQTVYIISSGILFLTYVLIGNSMFKAKQ